MKGPDLGGFLQKSWEWTGIWDEKEYHRGESSPSISTISSARVAFRSA
jgi:hypothetical protein